jgi:putative intracellular protease/amidase
MKILMVLTSHEKLGNTGRKTGFWLEEFAAPYYTFKDAGAEIVLASPKGGQPPLDPKSNEPNFQTDLTRRFEADAGAKAQLATTVRLDSVKAEDFDTVFYPGGHGPMWDLAEDHNSIKLIETMLRAGKPVALVCHAPGALRHAKTPDGKPLVQGKKVTGFTNTEEEAVGLQGRALPCRGRAEGEGWHLFQGGRLAALRPHRRPFDHRSESGLVRSRGQSSHRDAEQVGQVARARHSGHT